MTSGGNHRSSLALMLAAGAVLTLLIVPIAVAGSSGGPKATASASVKKKIKKLKQQLGAQQEQVSAQQQRLDDLEGELAGLEGAPGPPSGPAGGDLAGAYPNPSIGASAVDSGTVANNSLTGTDIDEATLNDPNEVFFEQQLPSGTGAAVGLASLGGVTFEVDCNSTPAAGTAILFLTFPDGFSLEGDTDASPILRSGPLTFGGAFTEADDSNSDSAIYQHEFHGADGTLVSARVAITTQDSEVGTDCVFYGSMRVSQT